MRNDEGPNDMRSREDGHKDGAKVLEMDVSPPVILVTTLRELASQLLHCRFQCQPASRGEKSLRGEFPGLGHGKSVSLAWPVTYHRGIPAESRNSKISILGSNREVRMAAGGFGWQRELVRERSRWTGHRDFMVN